MLIDIKYVRHSNNLKNCRVVLVIKINPHRFSLHNSKFQMFKIISLLFLHNIICPYKEVEGVSRLDEYCPEKMTQLESEKYYWFKLNKAIYLFYFDALLESHAKPFVVLVLFPDSRKTISAQLKDYKLLLHALDDFYKSSAFVSLVPNKPFYKISTTVAEVKIDAVAKLEGKRLFIKIGAVVPKELSHIGSLLEYVKFGTVSWQRFYNITERFYGLFIETYYVTYRTHADSVPSLRTADLIEISFVRFRTHFVNTKLLLTDKDDSFEVENRQDLNAYQVNQYYFGILPLNVFIIRISYISKGNKEEELEVDFMKRLIIKEVSRSKVEKLKQTGQRTFLFKDELQQEYTIKLPIFYFGERLEVSKLLLWVKVSKEKKDEHSEISELVKYQFGNKENCFKVQSLNGHCVFLDYIIDDEKIVFEITKMVDSKKKDLLLIGTNVSDADEKKQTKTVFEYLNGAIFCEQEHFITLTRNGFNTKEQEINRDLETFSEKSRYEKTIYVVICLILLVFGCLFGFLFPYFRKKVYKKVKLNRNRR